MRCLLESAHALFTAFAAFYKNIMRKQLIGQQLYLRISFHNLDINCNTARSPLWCSVQW